MLSNNGVVSEELCDVLSSMCKLGRNIYIYIYNIYIYVYIVELL